MPETGFATKKELWCLVGGGDRREKPRRVQIGPSPFCVGRSRESDLCLACRSVSSRHAEIIGEGGSISVVDLGSTNGTYVNGNRVHEATQLNEGDFVQFAAVVFRVARDAAVSHSFTVQQDTCDQSLALIQFDKLMSERRIVPFFQPIVQVETQQNVGYEMLVRSKLFGLQSPGAMFSAARELEQESSLSRLCRWEALLVSTRLPDQPNLFLNTHPTELDDLDWLTCSLAELRERNPHQPITLEIHEAAVTCPGAMRQLHSALKQLDMRLAYDDFGAGQARLVELVEVPPDYLKFDIKLIHGIHGASAARQQMLSTLVRMARELGIQTLAEGVESAEEGRMCRELGFDLAQGYYYGRPAPVSRYANGPEAEGNADRNPEPSDVR